MRTAAEDFFIQANIKYMDGDGIEDAELASLIHHYEKGVRFLELLGPEFGLAKKEARRRLHQLQDYRIARRNG